MLKIKRVKMNGKMFWYKSDDGCLSWYKISSQEVIKLIDQAGGVLINN